MTGSANPKGGAAASAMLGDFTVDRRLLILLAMALVVGAGGVAAAWGLLKLIALVTNLVWFGRFSTASVSLAHATRGPWMVLAPPKGPYSRTTSAR